MWISECGKCGRQFRDDAETAGVCPCGRENTYDDGDYGRPYLDRVVG